MSADIPPVCEAPDFLTVHAEGESVRLSMVQSDGRYATLLLDPGAADSISGIIFTESARAKRRAAEREGAHLGSSRSGDRLREPLDPADESLRGVLVSTVALPPEVPEADEPGLPDAWRGPWR